MARKSFRMVFTLCLILYVTGVGIVPADHACGAGCSVCCMQSGMENPQHAAADKGLSQSRRCCCGTRATPCDVSQGCASELPDFAIFAVHRVENPAPADIASTTTNVLHLNIPKGLTNKVWTLGMSPPVPIYLLNLSLLC